MKLIRKALQLELYLILIVLILYILLMASAAYYEVVLYGADFWPTFIDCLLVIF